MPRAYRRRTYRRRPYKRRSFKRSFKRKGKGPMGVRYFKMRYTSVVQSDAGGSISIFTLANPTAAWSGGGTVEDWTSVSSLFDSFRTCAVKWHYIPNLPNDASTVTNYKPLYSVFDVDAASQIISTAAGAIQYENMKVHNMYRPWKRYVRVPKSAASKIQGWVDIATPSEQYGALCGWGDGFNLSETYGNMIITYYIKCKDRR